MTSNIRIQKGNAIHAHLAYRDDGVMSIRSHCLDTLKDCIEEWLTFATMEIKGGTTTLRDALIKDLNAEE